ncbi:MAG: hypothetical protein AABN95_22480 [Acidobacteriota bacterium]
MLDSDPPTAGEQLLNFFDTDPVIAAEKLLRCREKLIRRFSVERCDDAEDLANETLRRVLDALNKDPQRLTTQIEAFISGFATNIVYESRRSPSHKEDPLAEISPANEPRTNPLDDLLIAFSEQEALRRCFNECLNELESSERDMLIRYYTSQLGEKLKRVRKLMALSMGLTGSQLRKLTFKLRSRLEICIKNCLPSRNKTADPA